MIVGVTVTYNSAEFLAPFLASYRAQAEVDCLMIIIDNASSDGTQAILDNIDDPDIVVIKNHDNIGVAAANNQGIREALARGAETVLLINNDTEFKPDLFAALHHWVQQPGVSAASPAIPYYSEPTKIWYAGGRFLKWRGFISWHEHYKKSMSLVPKEPFVTTYAPTCCLAFRRELFDSIGMMDERYFVYWDDTDYCYRMLQARKTIILDPRHILLHKVSASTGGDEGDFSIRFLNRNHIYFVRKHHSAAVLVLVLCILLGKAMVRVLQGRASIHQLKVQWKAVREGLALPLDRTPTQSVDSPAAAG